MARGELTHEVERRGPDHDDWVEGGVEERLDQEPSVCWNMR